MSIKSLLFGVGVAGVALFMGAVFVHAIPASYQRCDPGIVCTIAEYIFADDGYTPITTDGYCQITITDSDDVVQVNGASMSDKNDGWYYYTLNYTDPEGLYRATMCCDVGGSGQQCIDKSFVVGTSFDTLPQKIWGYTGSALDTAGNAISKVWDYASRSLTTRQIGENEYIAGVQASSTVDQVANATDQGIIKFNIELIRQATFDFAGLADMGSSSSTLVDAELAEFPNDHWNNSEVLILTGTNAGEKKIVCDFDRTSYTISLCSGFDNPIDEGDKFIISHDRKLINSIWTWSSRTLSSLTGVASDIWNYASRSLTTRQIGENEYVAGVQSSSTIDQIASENALSGLIDAVGEASDATSTPTLFGRINKINADLETLNTIDTRLDGVEVVADALRASQQLAYAVRLSDVDQVQASKTYRATLTITDYETEPINASSTPTITIYDAERTQQITAATLTATTTGVYEYTYTTDADAITGLWESVVSVDMGGVNPIVINDYWQVIGSPAQVLINSISDSTIPSISAAVTITNEGNADFEYQYEWCVVSDQANECGDDDDVYYASAAKLIAVGENFDTTLNATVTEAGTYWFKLVVYYGVERSGASNMLVATSDTNTTSATSGGGYVSNTDIYNLLLRLKGDIGYQGASSLYQDLLGTQESVSLDNQQQTLYAILSSISRDIQNIKGASGYNIDDLYTVSIEKMSDLKYLTAKTAELRALLEVNRTLVDKIANQPVVQTWYSEGSIVLNILVANPPDQEREVQVKEYLPRELRAEHIIELNEGLVLGYDEQQDAYYVSGNFLLAPSERRVLTVRAEDVFQTSLDAIDALAQQAQTLMEGARGSGYFAQASLLKAEIDADIATLRSQSPETVSNIERRISLYREQQKQLTRVEENINALKILISEVGGKSSIAGSLFGVSATVAWAIIIVVVVGVGVMMVMLYVFLSRREALEIHVGRKKTTKGNSKR